MVLRIVRTPRTIRVAADRLFVGCVVDLLEIRKLPEVKLVHLAGDHGAYREKAGDVLKQNERRHDDVDGSFQRRDDGRFVQQQKEHERGLE